MDVENMLARATRDLIMARSRLEQAEEAVKSAREAVGWNENNVLYWTQVSERSRDLTPPD